MEEMQSTQICVMYTVTTNMIAMAGVVINCSVVPAFRWLSSAITQTHKRMNSTNVKIVSTVKGVTFISRAKVALQRMNASRIRSH